MYFEKILKTFFIMLASHHITRKKLYKLFMVLAFSIYIQRKNLNNFYKVLVFSSYTLEKDSFFPIIYLKKFKFHNKTVVFSNYTLRKLKKIFKVLAIYFLIFLKIQKGLFMCLFSTFRIFEKLFIYTNIF